MPPDKVSKFPWSEVPSLRFGNQVHLKAFPIRLKMIFSIKSTSTNNVRVSSSSYIMLNCDCLLVRGMGHAYIDKPRVMLSR
jgi:hypothetical protein